MPTPPPRNPQKLDPHIISPRLDGPACLRPQQINVYRRKVPARDYRTTITGRTIDEIMDAVRPANRNHLERQPVVRATGGLDHHRRIRPTEEQRGISKASRNDSVMSIRGISQIRFLGGRLGCARPERWANRRAQSRNARAAGLPAGRTLDGFNRRSDRHQLQLLRRARQEMAPAVSRQFRKRRSISSHGWGFGSREDGAYY